MRAVGRDVIDPGASRERVRLGSVEQLLHALGELASLGVSIVTLAKFMTGKGGERQVEPTQLSAIRHEMAAQTNTLQHINREMGEAKAGIKAVDDKITANATQVENAFKRINAISIESSSVKDRLNDHLQDHRGGKFHA